MRSAATQASQETDSPVLHRHVGVGGGTPSDQLYNNRSQSCSPALAAALRDLDSNGISGKVDSSDSITDGASESRGDFGQIGVHCLLIRTTETCAISLSLSLSLSLSPSRTDICMCVICVCMRTCHMCMHVCACHMCMHASASASVYVSVLVCVPMHSNRQADRQTDTDRQTNKKQAKT